MLVRTLFHQISINCLKSKNMEKKSLLKGVRNSDMLSILIAVSILFSALTAVLGYESLSISNAMILAVFCVLACMTKDLKEFCNGLVEEGEEE